MPQDGTAGQSPAHDSVAAPQDAVAGPEFNLGQSVGRAVETLRLTLLDLTLRNTLLNTKLDVRESKARIRVVDELPDELFTRLSGATGSKSRLYLQPLPDPQDFEDAQDRRALRTEEEIAAWARRFEIEPAYDLPLPNPRQPKAAHRDNLIQTLLLPTKLEAIAQKLRETQRTAQQELGLGTLHAVFGYLEWYEADASNIALYAPLFLLPVQIDRELIRQRYRYYIEAGEGQDPVSNISLREKLRRDFGFELPTLEDEDSPETYMERVAEAIAPFKRWRVRRFATLGHAAFAKLAMYADLDPARWGETPPHAHDLITTLLAGSAGGDGEPTHADTYDVDDPDVARKVPLLIADSDSSQFSAVVDAMDGRSFALQGPPGTGKSQTITNMIAAALADNKTVLFVADKMAALEVVSKRLGDAGLAPFLLELHSTKTNKRRLLDSFAERLGLTRPRQPDDDFDSTLEQLEAHRTALRRYADLLNAPVGASTRTLHDVFWLEQRARRELADTGLDLSRLPIPQDAPRIGPTQINAIADALGQLRVFEQRVEQRAQDSGGLHPLRGVLSPGETDFHVPELERQLEALLDPVQAAERLWKEINDTLATDLDGTPQRWREFAERVLAMPAPTSTLDDSILSGLRQHELAELVRAEAQLAALQPGTERLEQIYVSVERALEESTKLAAVLPRLASTLAGERLHDAPIEQVIEELRTRIADLQQARQGLTALPALETALKASGLSGSGEGVLALLDAARLLHETPISAFNVLHDGLRSLDALEVLARYRGERNLLREHLTETSQRFDLNAAPTHAEVQGMADELAGMGTFGFWMGGRGRALRKAFRAMARNRKAGLRQMQEELAALARLIDRRDTFLAGVARLGAVGSHARGLDTPLEDLERAAQYVRDVESEFSELDAQRALLLPVLLGSPSVATLKPRLATLMPIFTMTRSVVGSRQWGDSNTVVATQLANTLQSLQGAQAALDYLVQVGLRATVGTRAAVSTVPLLQELVVARAELGSLAGWLHLPTPVPLKPEAHLERVREAVLYAKALFAASLAEPLQDALLGSGRVETHRALVKAAQSLTAAADAMSAARSTATVTIGFDPKVRWGSQQPDSVPVQQMRADLEKAAFAEASDKTDWIGCCAARERVEQLGLIELARIVAQAKVSPAHAVEAYRLVYLRGLINHAAQGSGSRILKRGLELSTLRQQVADLDRQYIELSRKRVVHGLKKREVPEGVSRGPVKQLTELGLLRNEIAKQRAHISIRNLLSRAAGAAQALKPCFMMSPASVSQFLPALSGWFDLVIIDEASQMRPAEAIGAISRGRQTVIVGDPKQLPPTSFYQSEIDLTSEGEDDDQLDIAAESILDKALSSMRPSRDLQWHYRSRHQSLISFSNRQFYRDRLTVFPSPVEASEDLGVRTVFVENGCYANSLNPVEADKVLEVLRELIVKYPDRSIGVVAVNRQQADLLTERWDLLCAQHEDLEAYRAKWSNSLEDLFIKNLENVQGDERDIIVISTVYGPASPGGPVMQRFGPINMAQGHRRLNVLFTRAKERVVLVTSLTPESIKEPDSASEGLRAFRKYLEFARTGRIETGDVGDGTFESPFEKEVAEVLTDHGFEVASQVGVAGYRIDLAVRSPRHRDHFLVGIECDGRAYHSAKSARDRDRLREQVLKGLHWNLYRIWSTDWFHTRDKEIKRLITHVKDLSDSFRRMDGAPVNPAVRQEPTVPAPVREPEPPAVEPSRQVTPTIEVIEEVEVTAETPFSPAALKSMCVKYELVLEDLTPRGGAWWVYSRRRPLTAEAQRILEAWQFRFAESRRGWWRNQR